MSTTPKIRSDNDPGPGQGPVPPEHGESIHHVRVRYAESDQMGFSYYANYLVWFEVGRTEWLRTRGCTYRSLEDDGYMLPVTEAFCRYLAPSTYDDSIFIYTRVGKLSRVELRFEYRLIREDGTVLATGHTEHCFLSKEGRPLRAPEKIQKLIRPEIAS